MMRPKADGPPSDEQISECGVPPGNSGEQEVRSVFSTYQVSRFGAETAR